VRIIRRHVLIAAAAMLSVCACSPAGLAQEQNASPAPPPGNEGASTPPQRAVLYEEDPNNPNGRRSTGAVIWRTEAIPAGAGDSPGIAIRADIQIPERRMAVGWSLRRNTEQALPASHTVEMMFRLPADFPGGGISSVPGIVMKQADQPNGTPLAGVPVKVSTDFFMIGLSDAEVQRNVALLKEWPYLDVLIVYGSGRRAVLALEKGATGERAFAAAFAAWGM